MTKTTHRRITACLAALAALTGAPGAWAGPTLTIVGSNTLAPFLAQWAAAAKAKDPALSVDIESPGTSVAPQALADDEANLGAMNRSMTSHELEAFIRRHGYYPTAIEVAIEAVGVYVNPANPLREITFGQLGSAFSRHGGCALAGPVTTWGNLGLKGPWAAVPLGLEGQDIKSAVRDFFKHRVMCGDAFKPGMTQLSEPQELAQVARNPYAIGFARYRGQTTLKALSVRADPGDPYTPLTLANVYNRSYRLQHFLYLYVNKPVGAPVSGAIAAFLAAGLSPAGQAAVAKAGYIPLSPALVTRELAKLR